MPTRSKTRLPSSCLLASVDLVEPQTYRQALSSPAWQAAMVDEYGALQRQGTWTLVPLPSGKQAIGCKWVFVHKKNSDGSIARRIRLDWWPRVFFKLKGWTIMKPSVL